MKYKKRRSTARNKACGPACGHVRDECKNGWKESLTGDLARSGIEKLGTS